MAENKLICFENVPDQVLKRLADLLTQARNQPCQIPPIGNYVAKVAQRNSFLETGLLPPPAWELSVTIIAAQACTANGTMSKEEYITFMQGLGFEIDEKGRRPGPELKGLIESLW